MVKAELEVIRQRARAATPGPWVWRHRHNSPELMANGLLVCDVVPYGPMRARFRFRDQKNLMVTALSPEGYDVPDADFIAHSREDIDFLLAEIDRLRAIERKV